jgi:hypothetical protein
MDRKAFLEATELTNAQTEGTPLQARMLLSLEMVKSARVSRAYITDRLFQPRVAGLRGLKDERFDTDAL